MAAGSRQWSMLLSVLQVPPVEPIRRPGSLEDSPKHSLETWEESAPFGLGLQRIRVGDPCTPQDKEGAGNRLR